MNIEFKEVNRGKILAQGNITHAPFLLKEFNIIDGKDGLFVSMPSRSYKNQNGKTSYAWLVTIEDEDRLEKFRTWVLEQYHAWKPAPATAPEQPTQPAQNPAEAIDDDSVPF